jgi:hypothetical protein
MYHTCALQADGTVVCWGDNSFGATAAPSTLGAVSQVSAGGHHTCALKTDGTVVCWGDNSAGATAVPATLGPVIQVSAGYLHTCALRADGTVACWDPARGNGSGESAVPFGLDLTPAAPDATAPVITYSTSPVPNAAGWNNASVSVIWSINDPESGISSSRGCDPISFATEGAGITQSCSASNGAGLSNSVSVTVNVDLTAPTIAVPANFTVNATAPSGALVNYNSVGTDALSGVASTSCIAASGSNFPIGVSSITCTATDRAGNNSTAGSFAVTVLGAPEQIANLIDYIKGTAIPTANKTILLAFLQKVLADPRGTAATCRSLNLLVAAVTAAPASVIPADKASHIIADATRIKDVIGCS